jgi:PAS domain S-box-containing protein
MTSTNPNDDKPLMAIPNANDGETIARTILERAPVLVYVVDLSFKVVLMNRELREISGWDTSKCRDVESLLTSFYPDAEYCAPIREIHEGWGNTPSEHVRDTVMVLTTTDGRQRSISWTTARLRVGRGPVRGYIAIGVDVTTRRNLEHWVTLFQQSLLQMREALALTDPEGGVLAWSAGASHLLGHREDDIQGRSLHTVFEHTGSETESSALSEALRSDSSDPFVADMLSASGDVLRLEVEVKKIASPNGDALAYLVQMAEDRATEPTVSPDDLAAALDEAKEAQNSSNAATEENDRLRLQLDESREAEKRAEEELVATRTRAEELDALLGEAKSQSEALQDNVEEFERERAKLLSELEETKTAWDQKREALVKKHVEELDSVVESSATERAEFMESVEARRLEQEEQHRTDILAAEERAEELREVLQEKHERARSEWDDAMAIAVHEVTEKKSLLENQIGRLLEEHYRPDGGLSPEGLIAVAALVGAPPPTAASTPTAAQVVAEEGADEDDLQLDEEVDQAIDAPPPVSPAMVATASELEVHQPAEMDSELELEPADDLNLDLDIEPLPGSDTLALDSEPLSGADDLELDDVEDDLSEDDLSEDDLSEDDLDEDDLSEDDLNEDDLDEDDLDLDEDDLDEDDLDLEIDEENSESNLEQEPTEEGDSSTKNPHSDEPTGSPE